MDILTVIFFAWIFISIAVFKLGTMLHEYLGLTESTDAIIHTPRRHVKAEAQKDQAVTSTDQGAHKSAVDEQIEQMIHAAALQELKTEKIKGRRGSSQARQHALQQTTQQRNTPQRQEQQQLPVITLTQVSDFLRTPPVASGSDPENVDWINDVFKWLHSASLGKEARESIFRSWVHTLSDLTRKSSTMPGVLVEVEGKIEGMEAPELKNLVLETGPCDSVTITGDALIRGVLQTNAITSKGTKQARATIRSLSGRLNIACIADEIMAIAKFDGWPEVDLEMYSNDPTFSPQLLESSLEQVRSSLRNAVVDLNFKHLIGFPRLVRTQSNIADYVEPDPQFQGNPQANDNLLVKVVKATGLGSGIGAIDPYCVVEMDAPPQRRQTSVRKETNCPFWDQTFVFELQEQRGEIMFEIHDKRAKRFLGLCLVGVEEILKTPSQRQIIPLQPRPYGSHDEEPISGSLTVEFLFMEKGSVVSANAIKNAKMSGQQYSDDSMSRPRSSSQRRASYKSATEVVQSTNNLDAVEIKEAPAMKSQGFSNLSQQQPVPALGQRPRGRRRTRDFLKSIKNRITRSVNRSKSLEPALADAAGQGFVLAQATPDASLDRQGDRSRSVPASDISSIFLAVPDKAMGTSNSSVNSELSHSSLKTYQTDASTLVLEAVEDGIRKYFLIPPEVYKNNAARWRGSGVKIHIFNNHCFVAKHLPSSSRCAVCGKAFPLRLGKTGYECRDCFIQTHKACHCRIEDMCVRSSVPTMEIELWEDQQQPVL